MLNVMLRSKTKWDQLLLKKIAERIEEDRHKKKWGTIIEVAKILPDDATVTQAECTAAVEAARAICCLARIGSIYFGLAGNLTGDCSRNNTKKKRNERIL